MTQEPRKIEQAADGLGQLKALLFQGEARRLDAIERTLGLLDSRVGDAPRLEKATAEIIVEALRDAEVARHRELADAIAPVVVAAIRNEIKNSREMMVEALYPLTGQMVMAAVQNAFRELVASINQRLDALTSAERWKLQIRSKITGRPVSELAMEQVRRGKIVRIFFLESGSGRLIESWRADETEDERADMVSGLIAALTGFARDALDAGANELRTLDLGGRKTFLRNSPQTIIAAETEGDLTREQIFALDQAFLKLIEAYGRSGAVNDDSLRAFAAQVDNAGAKRSRNGVGWPLKIAAGVVAALCIFLMGRGLMRWQQERRIDAAVAEVVARSPHLAAFPIRVTTDHGSKRLELKALVPTSLDGESIIAALQATAGSYALRNNVTIVASVDALEQRNAWAMREIEALRRELGELRAGLERLDAASASAAQVMEMQTRLEAIARAGASAAQVEDLRARVETVARTGAPASVVADLQSRLEQLGAASASATQVADLQARFDAIARTGASVTQVDDLRSRVEAVANAGAPASLVADLRMRIETLAEASAQTRRLNDSVARLTEQLAAMTARLDAPRARLAALIDGFAVFFAERERLADENTTLARLDAIADLMKREKLGIRVIGHTDAAGNPTVNQSLSRRRADIVAELFAARGVDPKKLVVVARAASMPISEQDVATRERNRRVTLELLYFNEETP